MAVVIAMNKSPATTSQIVIVLALIAVTPFMP